MSIVLRKTENVNINDIRINLSLKILDRVFIQIEMKNGWNISHDFHEGVDSNWFGPPLAFVLFALILLKGQWSRSRIIYKKNGLNHGPIKLN